MDIGHSSVTVSLLNLKFVCMLARSEDVQQAVFDPFLCSSAALKIWLRCVHAGNNCSQQIIFVVVIGSSLTDIVLSPHLHGTGNINGHCNIARVH